MSRIAASTPSELVFRRGESEEVRVQKLEILRRWIIDNVGGTWATQADIDAAIAALIAGAPGALDTLNELAAALNDDASFAATVTAALAAKQNRAPAVRTIVSAATVTPTFDDDQVQITAQAEALNLANPTGTAIPALGLVIRIKDDGTARAITYGGQYRAIGVTLPTTTVVNKTLYLGMIYNATDTKWDVVAAQQEA